MKTKLPFFFAAVICFIFLSFHSLSGDISYEVVYSGIEEGKVKEALEATSQLQQYTSRIPISQTALKRRAEADIDNLIKTLHALAYYSAKIELSIDTATQPTIVNFKVDTGPIYPLVDFKIHNVGTTEASFPFEAIVLTDLGIKLGAPAYPKQILVAEELLLKSAADKGFPQFSIVNREVIADLEKNELSVILYVDSGVHAYFGQTTISGHSTVKEEFLRKKIAWQEGSSFNIQDIAKTQEALEKSGLFSSATISYLPPRPGEVGVPIEVQLIEAKQRSIAAGLSYTTQRGVGLGMEWEHRNMFGMGQRLNASTNIWEKSQEAKFSYLLPDFGQVDQNLIWQGALEHEVMKGYTESSLSLQGIIERKVSNQLKISYGLGYKSIMTTHSDNNGSFHLLRMPLQLRWSTANSLLDPTTGHSVNLKITPTAQIVSPHFIYCPTTLTGSYYHPLTEDQRVVFAIKGSVGSIMGAPRHEIPPSERFYAGGENSLRGYCYQTVSPLDSEGKPIGGRSLMTLSLETRFRLTDTIGLVGFYDVGNVYNSPVPQFNHKQLQSVGVGVRYHTPVGPIRVDLAVPLDRRKNLDNSFQIYMSIGQSF